MNTEKKEALLSFLNLLLREECDYIEAVREIVRLQLSLGLEEDNDFSVIEGIEDETDEFPRGNVRNSWNSEALKIKDKEALEYYNQVKDELFKTCEILIEKYSN